MIWTIYRVSTAEILCPSLGPKISELLENNRLLLGFVSYFFRILIVCRFWRSKVPNSRFFGPRSCLELHPRLILEDWNLKMFNKLFWFQNFFKPIYYPSETTFLILRHTVRQPFNPRFTHGDLSWTLTILPQSSDRTLFLFVQRTAVEAILTTAT